MKHKNIGTSFDSFLDDEGIRESICKQLNFIIARLLLQDGAS